MTISELIIQEALDIPLHVEPVNWQQVPQVCHGRV